VTQKTRGLDIEATYRVPSRNLIYAGEGDIAVRVLATHFIKQYARSSATNIPTESVGENSGFGPPDWRWMGSISYEMPRYSATLSARGISSGKYSNQFIECSDSCPAATVDRPTINDNHMAGAVYFDAALTYEFDWSRGSESHLEAFFNVRNIANKDPAIRAPGPGGSPFYTLLGNGILYDLQGRVFRAGVRFRW
jgi:outer membrane receptor protein involved in Fe transport